MARGKRPKRGVGAKGGGLRRPPPAPPREPPSESKEPPPTTRRGGSGQPQPQPGGDGSSSRREGGGGSGGRSRTRVQQQQQQRNREDPPDDAPDKSPLSSLQAAARYFNGGHDSRIRGGIGPNAPHTRDNGSVKLNRNDTIRKKNQNRRPPSPPPSSTQDALPSYPHGDGNRPSEASKQRGRRPAPPPSPTPAPDRYAYDRRNTAKTDNLSSRCGGGRGRGNFYRGDDDGPLPDAEEEQYEEYQEQLYHQQYSARPPQSQVHQHDLQQQQQQQFSATHRHFNLTPIYNDEERTSSNDRGKRKNEIGRRRSDAKDDPTSHDHGRYYSQQRDGGGGREKKVVKDPRDSNPLEYKGEVLAYLDSDDDDGNSCGDADEAGGIGPGRHEMFYTKLYYDDGDRERPDESRVGELPRRHEEYYNHDDKDDDDDEDFDEDDEDEERPLRKTSRTKKKRPRPSRGQSQQSVLSRSEQCLNRTLVLAFLLVCFVFVRDRTPWWKAHKRRVALQRHHNRHGMFGGTDDDDLSVATKTIDPMAVYNSNDDDSTHTRDHDPLHQYDKFTKRDRAEEDLGNVRASKKILDRYDEFANKKKRDEDAAQFIREHTKKADLSLDSSSKEEDPSKEAAVGKTTTNKYEQVTAGERISNRPGKKSLHHGFMDETYTNRPAAENSESTAAVRASHGFPAPPPKSPDDEALVQGSSPSPGSGVAASSRSGGGDPSGGVVGASIMNGDALLSPNESNPQQHQAAPDAQNLEDTAPNPAQNREDENVLTSAPPHQDLEDAPTQPQDQHEEDMLANTQQLETSEGKPANNLEHHDLLVDDSHANDQQQELNDRQFYDDWEENGILLEWGDPDEVGVSSSMQQWSSGNMIDGAASRMGTSSASLASSNVQSEQGNGSDVGDVASSEIVASPIKQSSQVKDIPRDRSESKDNQNTQHAKEMTVDSSESVHDVASAQIPVIPIEHSAATPNQEVVTIAKTPPSSTGSSSSTPLDQPILNQAPLSSEGIKSVYEDSFYRWNHPLRPIVATDDGKDVPVFWRIPRSASGTLESVMSFCYRIVLANSMGTVQGHGEDEVLDVITVGTGAQYVNVDMSTPPGIQRAKSLNLGSSGLPGVVATPFLFETADIFDGIHESGKCFTLLRHPVDRAISLYHHYQIDPSGNPNTAQYKGITIDEFAEKVAENNWMVRFLANKRSGSLTWQDLEAAKEVFGRKCLVGLVDKAEESLRRYERFFKWDKKMPNSNAKDKCLRQFLDNGDKRREHPTYEGTTAWEALRKKNEYDVLLYQFAEQLYNQQSKIYDQTT